MRNTKNNKTKKQKTNKMSTEIKKGPGRPTLDPNGKKKQYGFVQLERGVYEDAKAYAKEHGYILSSFVGNAIKKYLKELNQPQKKTLWK